MRFQCTFCSYHMRGITDSMLGLKVRCPDCEKTNHINKDPFQVGRILGDFIIKRRLGVGSIGTVYFATQISLDRNVALKVLSKEYSNNKGLQSFLKEARSAATLSHPNLVQSFGVGEEEGICFMAMNFIEGETVKDKMDRQGNIETDEALHITQQVAEGLFYAWSESGLVHRDVKPENIMLTKESAVKLTDLGLAMNESEWDDTMDISGSPSYMSPEQFTGEKIDTRSDIYSLGISLYQMIAGKLPFNGATLKTVARQHFYDPPKPLNKINPMIPSKVSAFVQKMVAKEPEKRFQNMEEVIEQIWKVRQSTAPDIDLIPSVHTISLKRLDYDLQKLSKERNKHINDEKIKEKKKNRLIMKVVLVIAPIILGIAIILAMNSAKRTKINKINRGMVTSLKVLINSDEKSTLELMESWEEINRKLPIPTNDFNKNLSSQMLIYKQMIINQRLKAELDILKRKEKNIKKSATINLNKLIKKNKDAVSRLKKKEKELKVQEYSYKKATTKTIKSKRELNKSKNERIKLKSTITTLRTRYNKCWKDKIRTKIYLFAGQGKIEDSISILKGGKEKRGDFYEWFNSYIKIFELMQVFEKKIESSGSKYADNMTEQGRITNIIGGDVEISNIKEDITIPLQSLKIKTLLPIAKDIFPVLKDNELYKILLIYTNDISELQNLKIKDLELNNLSNAICEYKMDRIRVLYFKDEKKAKYEARLFLKEFENIPDINKRYKTELIKLFTQ